MTKPKAKTSKKAGGKKAATGKKAGGKKTAKRASLGVGDTATVQAADYARGYTHVGKAQLRLAVPVNAISIRPIGEPQTVYIAGLIPTPRKWVHLAKCGVPANSPAVVKVSAGTLAFSKRGGGDIVVTACHV